MTLACGGAAEICDCWNNRTWAHDVLRTLQGDLYGASTATRADVDKAKSMPHHLEIHAKCLKTAADGQNRMDRIHRTIIDLSRKYEALLNQPSVEVAELVSCFREIDQAVCGEA